MPKHAPIFHVRAAKAGIALAADVSLAWLTPRGHADPAVRTNLSDEVRASLDAIIGELGGSIDALAAKTRGSMRADFLLDEPNAVVEYDEIQHFTTARLRTLALYPEGAEVGFDLGGYREIVETLREKGDRGFAHKQAADFPGANGRQRQRAYFDAFRDLAAPAFGLAPTVRIPAPDNDYDAAVRRLLSTIAYHRRRRPLGPSGCESVCTPGPA